MFANIPYQLKTTELRLQKEKAQSRPSPSNGGKKGAQEEESSHWSARPVTSFVSSQHHRVHSSFTAHSVVSSFLPTIAYTSQSAPKALASPPDHTSPSGTQTPEQGHTDLTLSKASRSSQKAQHRGLDVSGLPGQNILPMKIAQVKVGTSAETTAGAAGQNSGLRRA